ncbi:PQQ-dependent sugar dehydrogenase [Paraferrimonas sp. SM1919]|uniref:PQQ-dependent sugar dehydrogenase n=1 Tax=Paraferrimonas sp. SM1919 TaxID=2662263 RepID=UPI0013D63D59|nr:PQQ-dependent sugar dehydrogenase [Paraferrimonas sp. SM1919]
MQDIEYSKLVATLVEQSSVAAVLNYLANSEEPELAEVAAELQGNLLLDPDNNQKVFFVYTEINDEGEQEQFQEFVMNKDDEVLVFIAWLFFSFFEVKHRETYAAVNRTYTQPKRS